MHRSKARKVDAKNNHHAVVDKRKEQIESIDRLIRGLDALITIADSAQMGTAIRILHMAKEELVHWAVDMKFHENQQDRFVNDCLYNNSKLSAIEALVIRAIHNSEERGKMLSLLESHLPKS